MHASADTLTIFIIQLTLLLSIGRVLGEIMHRLGQPAVMGQLVAGIILGPSVFGAYFPQGFHYVFPNDPTQKNMLEGLGQLGVLLLLLLTGMETDVALVSKMKRTACFTSLGGVVIPFLCGFLLGEYLPESLIPNPEKRILTSLFLATALSISSVKIVAMVLMEMNFMRRNVGQIILGSAILDDTIGWIVIAVIAGMAKTGAIDFTNISFSIAETIIFLLLSFTLGRRFISFLIRWINDNFMVEVPVITAIIVCMCAMALLTDAMGVHTVLGAFVAGILVGQSPILTKHIQQEVRGLIVALFMPVFFAKAGLSIDLTALADYRLLALTGAVIVIASFGKIVGCYLGGRLGQLSHYESAALAIGMNARGSTEIIVASIGLSLGALTQNLFTVIALMAVLTTLITPPLLRKALLKIPATGEERARLEKEAAEEKAFLPTVQRVLIAADSSGTGALAARLMGLIIGTRKTLSTVVNLDVDSPKMIGDANPVEITKESAEEAAASSGTEDATGSESVMEHPEADISLLFNAKEKNYDLLSFGVDSNTNAHQELIADAIERFKGPSLHLFLNPAAPPPKEKEFRILVPITGAEHSTIAAEVAVTLAKASNGTVTALHIANTDSDSLSLRLAHEYINAGKEFTNAIVELGKREKVEVSALVRRNLPVAQEILSRIRRGRYDLMIVGIKARSGSDILKGSQAAQFVRNASCPVLVVRV